MDRPKEIVEAEKRLRELGREISPDNKSGDERGWANTRWIFALVTNQRLLLKLVEGLMEKGASDADL